MTTALIDGDVLQYRCGFASEKTKYLVTGDVAMQEFETAKEAKASGAKYIWSRKEYEPVENCLQMVKSSLENTLNVLGTKDYRLYLSGRRNFRDDLYPEYKANRDGAIRPKYYRDIRDYLVSQWKGRVVEGIEADDALGHDQVANPDSVIVTIDKDLDQIPGEKYNLISQERYTVTPQDGMRFFYEQLLSGDPTDNIPGITGIGPAKAKKALAECTTPKELASRAYEMYTTLVIDKPDEIIDRNASLLWIQRKPNDKHPFWRHFGRENV